MRKPLVMAFGLVACAAGTGCATTATGTAPAGDGTSIYVTGARNSGAEVWLCPNAKTGEECQQVEVERQD